MGEELPIALSLWHGLQPRRQPVDVLEGEIASAITGSSRQVHQGPGQSITGFEARREEAVQP